MRPLVPHDLLVAQLDRPPPGGHVDEHPDDIALCEGGAIGLPPALVHLAALEIAVAVAVCVEPHRGLRLCRGIASVGGLPYMARPQECASPVMGVEYSTRY